MRILHFLFPFAFKKRNLADYTALIFYIALSLVPSLTLGLLFLGFGSFWQYVSIPFLGLFLYDLLAMIFATLSFFDLVKVKRKPRKAKVNSQAENVPSATASQELPEQNA